MRSAEALNHIPVSISLFTKDGAPLYTNPEAQHVYDSHQLCMRDRFLNPADHDKLMQSA